MNTLDHSTASQLITINAVAKWFAFAAPRPFPLHTTANLSVSLNPGTPVNILDATHCNDLF